MIVQLTVAGVMALSGFAGPISGTLDFAAPQNGVVEQAVTGAGTEAQDSTSASGAGSHEVSLKNLDIVVPPVAPSGIVLMPGRRLENPAAAGVVVADNLVGQNRVESEVVKTAGFQTLGVSWPKRTKVSGLGVQARTRTLGRWSKWVDLKPSDNAPDAGTPDAARAVRGGTDPVSIGNADAVQLAFATSASGGPAGLSLALIGSTAVSSAVGAATIRAGAYSTAGTAGTSGTSGAAALAAPTEITRAQWNAPAQACTPDVATTLVGAVVHHTADPNTYTTLAQAKQQIRNDALYHINSLGWCDIGYNFVVDKWGNIYEGRGGSLTQAVVGAHSGGFNTGTVGVAMLGTYDAAPSAATQRSVARIVGWRLGSYGVDPRGSMTYHTDDGGVGARFHNQNVTLPRVSGHRDMWFTACPGNGGYASLPNIRTMGYQLLGPNTSSPIGHVDSVTAEASTVTASGWAIDPDTSGPIMVQMYVDRAANSVTWANKPRPDIGKAYPTAGPDHGFTLTMPTTPGPHTVCIFAINSGPGASRQLSCHILSTSNNPIGHLESVTSGAGTVTAAGWALDPDTSGPIIVQMYVDRAANSVTWANKPRPDIGKAYPTAGPDHGFSLTMPTTLGPHTVCIFAINSGPGTSRQLSCQLASVP